MIPSLKKLFPSPVFRIVRVLVLAYLGLVGIMLIFQRQYIYYPSHADSATLEAEARQEGLVPWLDAQGGRIGWTYSSPDGSEGTLLIFHGNAGHALNRVYYTERFGRLAKRPAFREIRLFEYPGYADRAGRPSEATFVEAAQHAFDELIGNPSSSGPHYLLGESLGSGVATHLAASRGEHISGLLLITPFTRLSDVGQVHFPFLPVRLLLRDHFPNAQNLEHFESPVVILTAEHDGVVPARLGRQLYLGLDGPKQLFEIAGADHNTLFHRVPTKTWIEAIQFLRAGD